MNAVNAFFQSSSFWAVFITIVAYAVAVQLQHLLKTSLCNPILAAVVLVILILKVTGTSNGDYQNSTKYLSYLLTPATICLGLSLYEQMQVLRRNLFAILLGVLAGTIASLILIFLLSNKFRFNQVLTISLLPKSITTAIGLPLSEEAGGIGAITTVAIILSGILGNLCGHALCKLFRITHPIARGTAFGTASHVIGTAKAYEYSQLMGAVGSLALITAGLVTAILYPLFLVFVDLLSNP